MGHPVLGRLRGVWMLLLDQLARERKGGTFQRVRLHLDQPPVSSGQLGVTA